MHRRFCRQAGRLGHLGGDRAEDIPGLAKGREEGAPPLPVDQRGIVVGLGCPEMGLGAERCDFRRRHARQAPGPILRVRQDVAGSGELFREGPALPEDLPAQGQASGIGRGAGLVEAGGGVGIGRLDVVRRLGLVVHDRQRQPGPIDQGGGGTVGAGHDGADRMARRQPLQRREQPLPDRRLVHMKIARALDRAIRGGLAVQDPAVRIDRQQLQIGLAEVEDCGDVGQLGLRCGLELQESW